MTAARVAERPQQIPASGIRAIGSLAAGRAGAIKLHIGEPSVATPAHIVEAAHRAAMAGHTHYGPTAGLPALREAIAAKLVRDNGWAAEDARAEDVVVTAGGVGALYAAYNAILDRGDAVLVPDPGWPNFASQALALGAVPVGYPLDPVTGAPPDLGELDRLLTDRTRAIVVNAPSNPTGATWTAEQLRDVARWAGSRGLWVVSDECYDQLGLEGPLPSLRAVAPEADSISVFSFSKTYAMTGWRVGYAVGTGASPAVIARVQESLTSCGNTMAQEAATAALLGPQDLVATMRATYRERRDAAAARCDELGLTYLWPRGAFYLWLTLPPSVPDDAEFAVSLLTERGVSVAPGSAFGATGAGRVRVSLAAELEEVLVGLERLAEHAGVSA